MTDAHPSRLETLLRQALPEPKLIKGGGDGAIVALALHCAWSLRPCMLTSSDRSRHETGSHRSATHSGAS